MSLASSSWLPVLICAQRSSWRGTPQQVTGLQQGQAEGPPANFTAIPLPDYICRLIATSAYLGASLRALVLHLSNMEWAWPVSSCSSLPLASPSVVMLRDQTPPPHHSRAGDDWSGGWGSFQVSERNSHRSHLLSAPQMNMGFRSASPVRT